MQPPDTGSSREHESGGPEDSSDPFPSESLETVYQDLLPRLRDELAPDLEVVRLLDAGEMAGVYLAREPALRRLVSLKVLSPEVGRDETPRGRFEREARAIAAISHPNIVTIYGVRRLDDGLPVIVMQHVKGRSLRERLVAQGLLPPEEARKIVRKLALALDAAHEEGIVHRDLRPENVLCEKESDRVLLTNFGLAAVMASGEEVPESLTGTGEVVGHPGYMSPEQMMRKPVTEQSDVFGLGVLAYELVCGRKPFDADTGGESLRRMMSGDLPPLTAPDGALDPELESIVEQCLSLEPGHRPEAADVARRLTDEPVTDEGTGEQPVVLPSSEPEVESEIEEEDPGLLKRVAKRRIPQFVAGFAAGGWIVLEATDQLIQQGLLPSVLYRLALTFYVSGLLATGIVAWFHGERGTQRIPVVEVWLLGLLALVWLLVSAGLLLT